MNLISKIKKISETPEFKQFLQEKLISLCKIDSSPRADTAAFARAEAAAFDIISETAASLGLPGLSMEKRRLNPEIEGHPAFTPLHYTKSESAPEGVPVKTAFDGRYNLLAYLTPARGASGSEAGESRRGKAVSGPGGEAAAAPGPGLAVNAHIDVVHPYIPPRLEDGILYGRGACDDKGPLVSILGALKVLSSLIADGDIEIEENLLCMFVTEEETGGNGSLSLAVDKELKSYYDRMIVLECCGNKIHPAGRGAVWYKTEITVPSVNQFEMAAFIIEEMEKEGRSIKAESRHPLFPERPVQTCHGIMGPVGEHPSTICGEISFDIRFNREQNGETAVLLQDCIDFAVEEYCGRYGDKTKVTDPKTGKAKVDRHYRTEADDSGLRVTVYGSSGHMGSIMENDNAITKMTYMLRALIRSRARIERETGAITLTLRGHEDPRHLVLEGGQGFVPTHSIEEVQERIRTSAEKGAAAYLLHTGADPREAQGQVRTTFCKLHNNAFERSPDSKQVRTALAAGRDAGIIGADHQISGWAVSCDARLFADEYPDMPIITSGAGKLEHAHSAGEHIDLQELFKGTVFLADYIVKEIAARKRKAE